MPKLNTFDNHEEFSRRYLQPLFIKQLQSRLDNVPDFATSLPAGAVMEPEGPFIERSGVFLDPETGDRAVVTNPLAPAEFVRTAQGWNYRDHVLLEWQLHGQTAHRRVSEQDLQYGITVSRQPDQAGVPRLTVDVHATLMRYECDKVTQQAEDGKLCDLGKGWARASLQWSLRLQLVVSADGRAHVVSQARRGVPVTDAARTGAYIVSDPLHHLLNMPRLTHGWEHGPAGLTAIQDQLVSRLAAAIEPALDDPHEHV